MDGVVAYGVADGVAHFRRCAKDMGVIAVGEDRSAALHDAVERPGHANGDGVHALREGGGVGGFDDEVKVVALDTEMAEAHAPAVTGYGEGAGGQGSETATGTQIVDVWTDAEGDVDGGVLEAGAAEVGEACAWLLLAA